MGSDTVAIGESPVKVYERGLSIDLTEKSTMRRTKSCLSVSTLEASLNSVDNIAKNRKKKMTKQVSFHNLQIREYKIELGDNPSCRFGPPVTIGWDYNVVDEILLDDMMPDGDEEKKERKLLDVHKRYDMVRDAGFSDADIMKTVKDVSMIRKKRYKSINNEKYDKINERIENISRKFKNLGKLKDNDMKANIAPKMSRNMSLNSLSLRLPRRNSLQNLQLPSQDALKVRYHKTDKFNTSETSIHSGIDSQGENSSSNSKSEPIVTMNNLVNEIQGEKENDETPFPTNPVAEINAADETQNDDDNGWGYFD